MSSSVRFKVDDVARALVRDQGVIVAELFREGIVTTYEARALLGLVPDPDV